MSRVGGWHESRSAPGEHHPGAAMKTVDQTLPRVSRERPARTRLEHERVYTTMPVEAEPAPVRFPGHKERPFVATERQRRLPLVDRNDFCLQQAEPPSLARKSHEGWS